MKRFSIVILLTMIGITGCGSKEFSDEAREVLFDRLEFACESCRNFEVRETMYCDSTDYPNASEEWIISISFDQNLGGDGQEQWVNSNSQVRMYKNKEFGWQYDPVAGFSVQLECY